MTEGKRFSKESFIYVFGESLSKALAFFLLPIYTSYLSVADFAVLSIVSVLWPIIVIILGQGFSAFIIRGYYDNSDKKEFIGTVLIFSMIVGVAIASTLHLIGPWLFQRIFKQLTYRPYLQYGVFFAVFRLYFTHVVSTYRAKRQAKTSIFLSFILFSFNSIAVIIAIYLLDAGLNGILNAQLFAYFIVAIVYTLKISSEIKLKFNLRLIIAGIWFVLPLIPHALSAWLINYVGRIFVERYMSLTDLSIFSVATQLAMILSVINNGLNQAWTPFVYANYNKANSHRLLSTNAQKAVLLVLFLGVVLILFSKELLIIIGKIEYLLVLNVLPILVVSYIFQMIYFIQVAIIIYNMQSKLLPVISISSGLVCLLSNILLIPKLGIYGAAIGTSISFILMAFFAYQFSRRYLKVQILNVRIFIFLLFMLLILSVYLIFIDHFSVVEWFFMKIVLLFSVVILLVRLKLLNFRNLKELFQSI